MTFVYPRLLWWIVPLFGIALWMIRRSATDDAQLRAWIHPRHWKRVVPGFVPHARLKKRLIVLAAFFFGLLSAARPQWGEREEISETVGLDVMIVLDLSNSMEAEDLPPSRLSRSKHWIKTLLGGLEGDRVGLVGFASSAHVFVPLTQDLKFLETQLQSLTSRSATHQGTDIGLALEVALSTLERGARNELQSQESITPSGTPSHALILITDGEDHEKAAQSVAARFAQAGVAFFGIGVGTQQGGPVPVLNDQGEKLTYKKDARGKTVISRFVPKSLQTISGAARGRYLNLTADESEVQEVLNDLGKLARGAAQEKRVKVKEERYQWPLAAALVLLLAEFGFALRGRLMGARIAMVVSTLSVLLSAPVFAGPLEDLKVYRKNQEGLAHAQSGRTEDASRSFEAAQNVKPEQFEPSFNLGVQALKKGDADQAVGIFDKTAESAVNPDQKASAHYNGAVAAAGKKDFSGAAERYLKAIEWASQAKNKELEEKARKNLELLYQKQEEQKQQESQKQKKDSQNQSQDASKSDSAESKNESGSDAKSEEGKQSDSSQEAQSAQKNAADKNYQNKRTSFKSQKLSEEDAQRVMNDLQAKEREVQARIRKQGKRVQTTEQDW